MKSKICFYINSIIRRGHWFNNVFFQDYRKFRIYNTFNTKVVNLGSTSALHAFNYDDLDMLGANWAISRNPLLGDFQILRNYCSYLSDNATVIIPLCPFSSLSGSYDYLDDRYYKILYPSSIPNYSYVHDVHVTYKWNNPILFYPWYALFIDIWHLIFKKKPVSYLRGFRNDAEAIFNSWCHEFSIKDFSVPLSLKNSDGIQDAEKIINDIIDFCNSHNYKTAIVIPPVYITLYKQFSKEAFDILFSFVNDSNICKRTVVKNYLYDEEFSNSSELFVNSFLLNEKGAKRFTNKVLTDLKIL